MRHVRDSKLKLFVVVLAASLVLAAGCGPDAVRVSMAELKQAVVSSGAKIKNPGSWLQSGKTAASQTDDLTRALAKTRTELTDESRMLPEVAEQLRQGEALQAAIQEADAAAVVAGDIGASLASDAQRIVSRSATVRSPGEEETVAALGEDVLQDLICSVATDIMAPEEKSEADKQSSAFSYMADKSSTAIYKALTARAAGRLGAVFSRGFQWGTYGADLATDANRHIASIRGQIESPDLTVTKAYIYMAKVCLAPPAR